MAHEGNRDWLRKWLSGTPHQIIGPVEDPYLLRWYVIPKNRLLNLYLHKFCRSDDDRALHDHPWPFVSFILKGSYWEHRADRVISAQSLRKSGSVAFRRAKTAHRVELDLESHQRGVDKTGKPKIVVGEKPVWTLILTGPKVRRWGFLCQEGWKWWKDYIHDGGCGEN